MDTKNGSESRPRRLAPMVALAPWSGREIAVLSMIWLTTTGGILDGPSFFILGTLLFLSLVLKLITASWNVTGTSGGDGSQSGLGDG